jgi:hypothetical protein
MSKSTPLIYENVFRKRALARTKDTEKSITVTLAAGKGTIIDAYAFDETFNKITKAYPGQKIGFYVTVRNDGDTDWLWVTGKDKDTGAILVTTDGMSFDAQTSINAGKTWGYQINWFTMPNRNFNVLIEAGHGQA